MNDETAERTILLAGDWAPTGRYERLLRDDPLLVYGDLLETLRTADLRIVNLECPLGDRGSPIPKDGPHHRADRSAAEALARVPFEVACLANNHVFDHGPEALEDTRDALERAGLRSLGAGATREEALAPLIVEVGPARVGLVNFSEGEDDTSATHGAGVFGFEIDTAIEIVRDLRSRVDVVIVIAHAGREYAPSPPPYIQAAYRAVAAAGADAVVGHHPHVPQGIEVVDGVPIVYSQGNFVFHQKTRKVFQRLGYLVSIELTGTRATGFRAIPYRLTKTGLRALDGGLRTWFFDRLDAVSEILADPARVRDAWNAFVDDRGEEYWRKRAGGFADLARLVRKKPAEGAAKFRNRLRTPAHACYLSDGFTRLAEGTLGTASPEARAIVTEWRTTTGADLKRYE